MAAKTQPRSAASTDRHSHGIDEAMKAGIGAAACSLLILFVILLAMWALPISMR